MKIDDDELTKMFEGIIQKEYLAGRMDYMGSMMISQQDRTKDSKDKQPVQADLHKSADSRESG